MHRVDTHAALFTFVGCHLVRSLRNQVMGSGTNYNYFPVYVCPLSAKSGHSLTVESHSLEYRIAFCPIVNLESTPPGRAQLHRGPYLAGDAYRRRRLLADWENFARIRAVAHWRVSRPAFP